LPFQSEADKWVTLYAPLDKFQVSFRGYLKALQIPFPKKEVHTWGFTPGGDVGDFRIEVGWIRVARSTPHTMER